MGGALYLLVSTDCSLYYPPGDTKSVIKGGIPASIEKHDFEGFGAKDVCSGRKIALIRLYLRNYSLSEIRCSTVYDEEPIKD